MNTKARDINLAEMSDEEISNLDVSSLPEDGEANSSNTQSATESREEGTVSDETGGADSDNDSDSQETQNADSTSAESDTDTDREETASEKAGATRAANQTVTESSEPSEREESSSSEVDYKAELSKVMAPLKAAKREIRVTNSDEVRRLMQMGVDYSRKMEAMKPYQQVLKTLEKNNLLSIDKINFLIDLDKKNPEAIRKFLKDGNIDTLGMSLEDDVPYKPTNHMVSENDLVLEEVLDSIKDTPSFSKTVDVLTKQWDEASKRTLVGVPQVIRYINDHIENGIFDMITDRLENERIFGKHAGLSDLEAYKAVGDAMHSEGAFNKLNPKATQLNSRNGHGNSQDSQAESKDSDLRNRKRAAGTTKGSATTKKQVPNFLAMSDADIEKFDIRSLSP